MGDDFDEPRCRVCGNRVQVRSGDDVAAAHRSRVADWVRGPDGEPRTDYSGRRVRGRCPGSFRPIAGEPPCTPDCRVVGTWGVLYERGKPHASTVVCGSREHQREAAEWVRSITGVWGSFTRYPEKEVEVWEPPE